MFYTYGISCECGLATFQVLSSDMWLVLDDAALDFAGLARHQSTVSCTAPRHLSHRIRDSLNGPHWILSIWGGISEKTVLSKESLLQSPTLDLLIPAWVKLRATNRFSLTSFSATLAQEGLVPHLILHLYCLGALANTSIFTFCYLKISIMSQVLDVSGNLFLTIGWWLSIVINNF